LSDDAESGKWLKVKARMPSNQKVIALSDAAFRLHISVSCWCADEVTNGRFKAHVPSGMPKAPRGKRLTDAIAEIVGAGLWHPTEDGYEINDFLKYNMSRAQWEAKKEAGRLGGQRSGDARRSKSEAPPEAPASAPARARPQPPPEHDHDHDHEERSNKPPPKDLTRSARSAAPVAAAALDLDSGARAFVEALVKAWRPFVLSPSDPLLRLVGEHRADATDERCGAAGAELGRWLAKPDPAGKSRGIAAAGFGAVRKAFEDARAAETEAAAKARERAQRAEDRRGSVVHKTGPKPLAELLEQRQCAADALKKVTGG
jgi:hypothetical protein